VDDIKVELQLDSENVQRMKDAVKNQYASSSKKPVETSRIRAVDNQEKSKTGILKENQISANQIEQEGLQPTPQKSQPTHNIDETAHEQELIGKALPTNYIPPEPELPPSYNIWNGDEIDSSPINELVVPNEEVPVLTEENSQGAEVKIKTKEKLNPDPQLENVDIDKKTAMSNTGEPLSQSSEHTSDLAAPPAILPPPLQPSEGQEISKKAKPQMLTIVMRSLGDKERDILRMRRVYGMLISDPGPDRFAFYVIEKNRGYRLEFPSDTTHLTDLLMKKLEILMGKENIILEPITIL